MATISDRIAWVLVPSFLSVVYASAPTLAQNFLAETIHSRNFRAYAAGHELTTPNYSDFFAFENPLELRSVGAVISAAGNLIAYDDQPAIQYDIIINWGGFEFPATICQYYIHNIDYLATSIVVSSGIGFGGINDLEKYAQSSCEPDGETNAVPSWRPPAVFQSMGLAGLLQELDRRYIGRQLLNNVPNLPMSHQLLFTDGLGTSITGAAAATAMATPGDAGVNATGSLNRVHPNAIFNHPEPDANETGAFAKPQSITQIDVNDDGFAEILTFPSNFITPLPIDILSYVATGDNYLFNSDLIRGDYTQEFVRDRIVADFNSDGHQDLLLVDHGWELNNRNAQSFLGGKLHFFVGNGEYLQLVPASDWLTEADRRAFNHIGSHGDVDGDGDVDVVIASMSGPNLQGGLRVLINDGNAHFSEYLFGSEHTGIVGDPSGVVVVETVNGPRIIAAGYRSWIEERPASVPVVFKFLNGTLIRESFIEKPFPNSTVWMNYGGADGYAADVNNDGLQDYIQNWETETTNTGIIDEWTSIGDIRVESRYENIGLNDDMLAVYIQTTEGEFLLNNVFPLKQNGSPLIEFVDVNGDGWTDFYTHGFGVRQNSIHETIWLNDGSGQFGNPEQLTVNGFGPRLNVTGFLADYDLDQDFDFVGLQNVGGSGERLFVFRNDGVDFDLDDATVVNHLISMRDFFGFQVEQGLQNDRSKVRQLQTALNQLGYNAGSPDGIFGPATRRAIEAFNADYSGRFVAGLTQSNAAAILSAVE